MKFTCDKCGKRFASVDEPLPGRVYKIRCGRCAHLISVQAPVPWEDPDADVEPPPPVTPAVHAPDEGPWLVLPRTVAIARVAAPVGEGSEEVSIDLALSDEYPLQRRRQARRKATALFILSGTAALALTVLVVLLARGARRASPGDVAGAPRAEAPPPSPAVEVARVASPEPREPGPELAAAPLAAPAATAAPRPPAPRPAPAASRRIAAAAPAREAAARAPAATERARPPRGAVAFEREAAASTPPPPGAPAPAAMDADLAAALHAKDDAPVRAVPADPTDLRAILDGRRAVLDACFDGAPGTGAAAAWAGRTPQLVVRIDPSGSAAGRVDDAALEPTAIASCLRRTVSRFTFPPFGGDPVELAVPVGLPPR